MIRKMNIYLDINGVILTKDLQPANYVYKFLKQITKYPAFWLTTHCKGDSKCTIEYLRNFLNEKTIKLAENIKPTSWSLAKTEALDYNEPFLWFDNVLFDFEKQDLIKHNALKNWVEIDLIANPNQLRDLIDCL